MFSSNSNNKFANGTQQNHISIRLQIKHWATSGEKLTHMTNEYERCRGWWEKNIFSEINKTNILKDLAKYHRYDVLDYIITNYPNYMNNLSCSGFTPLHSAVWRESPIENIKKTLDVLLNKYKFRILMPCQDNEENKFKEHKYETILGAIYETERIPLPIKNEIYEYIISKNNDSWYMNDFQMYINKLNNKIFNIFLNKILFIFNQYFDKSINVFFKNLMSVRIGSKIVFDEKIHMYALVVISLPNDVDKEMNKYFKENDIKNLETKIIDSFIKNDDEWIKKSIDHIDKENQLIYIETNYKNLFSFYGSLYRNKHLKSKILDKINTFINNDLDNINKYILHFILHSNMNLKNMNETEQIFISKCINKYYNHKNIRFAVNFENVFKILLNLQYIKPENILQFNMNTI
jgi:hypothetical protein